MRLHNLQDELAHVARVTEMGTLGHLDRSRDSTSR